MTNSGRGTTVIGYNVQAAVDTTHHLIEAHEVTNATTDRAQLAPMGKQAQEVTGRTALTVLADRGYFADRQIVACEKARYDALRAQGRRISLSDRRAAGVR